MKPFKVIFTTILFLPFLIACTESTPELSDVVIFVSTQNDEQIIESGDKVQYTLEMSTIHKNIERFSISSFDSQYGKIIHIDSICTRNKIDYSFIYAAPEINRDSLNVELYFEVFDNENNSQKVSRTLLIKNRMVSIAEQSGITLYMPQSGMPNAVSLNDVSQPFVLETSPDSLSADIYVEYNFNKSILWKSKTKLKFIRNNSFNYVNATANSINAVFQSSVRTDQVEDIKNNDIILVGHNNAKGVFLVRNIIQNENNNKICLQLSFKGIKR